MLTPLEVEGKRLSNEGAQQSMEIAANDAIIRDNEYKDKTAQTKAHDAGVVAAWKKPLPDNIRDKDDATKGLLVLRAPDHYIGDPEEKSLEEFYRMR